MLCSGLGFVLALSLPYQIANSCQVYPSDYAYHEDSFTRTEVENAMCSNYQSGLSKNAGTEMYMNCKGTPLRLTDSDIGLGQYNNKQYYVLHSGATYVQLLFIFSTTVNLTNITLHYYSDHDQGLPALRFYSVPDNFSVWAAPVSGYSYVAVSAIPPNEQPVGRKHVNVNFNFTTKRVLLRLLNNDNMFAVSEVQFSTCNLTTVPVTYDSTSPSPSPSNNINNVSTIIDLSNTTAVTISGTSQITKNTLQNTESYQNSTISNKTVEVSDNSQLYIVLPVVTTVVIMTVVLVVVLLLLLFLYRKKSRILKTDAELDDTYSTLDRGTKQQMQPQFLDASAGLYDQIQLSPSTGQSELISKTECPTSHTSLTTSHHHKKEEHHETEIETSKSELLYATYAVVDKTKSKKKSKNNKSSESLKNSVCGAEHPKESSKVEKPKDHQNERKENLEEMYAVVQKKSKKPEEQVIEEMAPPVPSHTIECLYTAVQKKPK